MNNSTLFYECNLLKQLIILAYTTAHLIILRNVLYHNNALKLLKLIYMFAICTGTYIVLWVCTPLFRFMFLAPGHKQPKYWHSYPRPLGCRPIVIITNKTLCTTKDSALCPYARHSRMMIKIMRPKLICSRSLATFWRTHEYWHFLLMW